MRRSTLFRSPMLAVLVAVVAIGPATSAAVSASPPPNPGTAAGTTQRARAVTLITGDRVMVTDAGHGGVAVLPGPGREQISFLTERIGGRTYVLPTDTLSLVGSGRLDRRLFDLTSLLEFGYDDARRADLPLIVQYAKPAQRAAARAVPAPGAAVGSDLPAARGLAVRVDKRQATGFWSTVTGGSNRARALAGGVDRIWLDGKRRVRLDQSVPQVGAPLAWAAGVTGAGVTVGVLDTGVDSTHPDLAGRVLAEQNFTDAPDAEDFVGHGTHVASIITGSGAASGGTYQGMAPDAKLVSGKVCADIWCTESAMLAGMQWAAADQQVKIVNFSIGGYDTPEIDPIEEAVNTLTARYGTLFVVSAGNDGPAGYTVNSPGSADAALTVASVTKQDEVAEYSSRGPRVGDNAIKPDIAAPGVDIVAAKARNSWIGEPVGDAYLRLSGTSMAAPHVAGAAALLASQHPDWGPGILKAALMSSATVLPATDVFSAGTGRLDVARAVTQQVVAEPASLSLGTQLWPHGDDEPLARTITYRNFGAAPVTMAFAADVGAPYGEPPPAGMFTVSPAQLTVPAGGSGTVTVTADTRGDVPVGWYTGRIRATADGAQVAASAVALEVEPERYAVTLRHTDGAGSPATWFYTRLLRSDMYDERYVGDGPSTVTLRLPRATYLVSSVITTGGGTPEQRDSLFAYPLLTVDRDVTVDFDVRQAQPVRFTAPDAGAAPVAVNAGFDGKLAWTTYSWQLVDGSGPGITTLHLGPRPGRDEFVGRVEAVLGRPDVAGGFATSPYWYNLAWYVPRQLPTGFDGTVSRDDLATVNAIYLAMAPGFVGNKTDLPYPTVADWLSPGSLFSDELLELPRASVEYYMVRDVRWLSSMYQLTPDRANWFQQSAVEPVDYQSQGRYDVRWNGAVLGPSGLGNAVTRDYGYLHSAIPMFSDGTPGHLGDGPYDTARTVLYRNGVQIAETHGWAGGLWAAVPMEASTYRLSAEVSRTMSDVSTRISAAWTFESGYLGQPESTVPIITLRFSPSLDDTNTAPADRRFAIPIQVEGAVDGVRTLAAQASYDDGGTWQPAIVTSSRDGWQASVTHPAGAGHVALRAQATDGRGNTVQLTIIRAYHLG